MRLALALGRTVAELEASLSTDEFAEWMAYWQLEPFGPEIDDQRAGTIAAATYNCAMTSDASRLGWSDIFIRDPEEHAARKQRELAARIEAAFEAHNARLKRGRG